MFNAEVWSFFASSRATERAARTWAVLTLVLAALTSTMSWLPMASVP